MGRLNLLGGQINLLVGHPVNLLFASLVPSYSVENLLAVLSAADWAGAY